VSSSRGISFWVAHGAFGFFSMADLKLLKKVHLLPKLSLATCLQEYYVWEEHMEDFFWGHGLESALKIYYAEEIMATYILHWWDRWDKKIPCWTWSDMKLVLRRQFRSLESKKKVATVYTQNPQGTKVNMRLSWADSIAGDEYVAASNRQAVDSNSHKKLVSGATYGKSMHAEIFSPPKLKHASGQRNYGKKLTAFAHSSLGPKKKCVSAKEIQYIDNQKFMMLVKKLEAISSSAFSCAKPPERKYASSISEISSHPPENSKEVAAAEKETEEKSTEPLIDIVDDTTNGLSMLAQEVKSDGTVVQSKGIDPIYFNQNGKFRIRYAS
jgi:hypothetical protein